MPIILTETDTAADDCTTTQIACSGFAASGDQSRKKATAGGTAGTTAVTLATGGTDFIRTQIGFQSANDEPNSTSWESGNWVVRVEVTTSNMNVTWENTYVCRITGPTGGCAASNSVGSLTSQGTSLGTTGVKTHTVSGAAQAGAAATDEMAIMLATDDNGMVQSWAFKPSQNIDTPVNQDGLMNIRRHMDAADQNATMFAVSF